MKNNIYAVILAGGSGTRFWPLSRQNKPKQFLNVTGKNTLLQETARRIRPIISGKNIFIVTNQQYKKEVESQLRSFGIPSSNILLEPSGKNTAPAICWAASRIYEKDKQAVLAVLPSDHLILNEKNFIRVLNSAVRLAQRDFLVTLGIGPTRPETGYGYLKIAPKKGITYVSQFTEKPNSEKAKQFIKNKNYLWNSGMFIWKASVILNAFKKDLPDIYSVLSTKTDQKNINRIWNKIKGISIDYGILEKSKNVVAVPAYDIGWSDLGSWESLLDVLGKDKNGNVSRGNVLHLDCQNSLFFGEEKHVAVVGLKDVIVIDVKDTLLVCSKSQAQRVRDIVEILKSQKSTLV
jgi:mannose-1-phosphate guanylyltransferase